MKKYVLGVCAALFAFAATLTIGAQAAADNVYAILYDDGTLVFQYGNAPKSEKTVTKTYEVDLNAVYGHPSNYAPWYKERKSVRVADFADKISPTATALWFYECANLNRVDNIQNLNTANVTNMYSMFAACSGLTALDLSSFDTANVTQMSHMFDCCIELTALDVSGFDTANVTSMSGMFDFCRGLTALDLSSFDTANVTSMSFMFSGCSNLKTIYASEKITTVFVPEFVPEMDFINGSGGMFSGCTELVGGNGTKYDSEHIDGSYARIDAPDAPGYFTAKSSDDAPSGDFQTASAFCAVYDRDGCMVHLQVWEIDLSDPLNITMDEEILIPKNVEVGKIRVFVLSENLVPLRAAKILK